MNQSISQSVLALIAINVVVFIAQQQQPVIENLVPARYIFSESFRPWQIITHMFAHGGIGHLFFNMFALWMFGDTLAKRIGDARLLKFYFISGLAAFALYNLVLYLQYGNYPLDVRMLGASGAVYGVLVGFAMLYPNTKLMLIFLPIPIAAKYFVPAIVALDLILGVRGANTGIAHFAHIGGAVAGALLMLNLKRNYNL